MNGRVVAVCRSLQRERPKEEISGGFFREGWGLIGDAHAGTAKEVSLLLQGHVDVLARETGMVFPPGAFAENLLVSGLSQENLSPGKFLQIGDAVLSIDKIGKEPNEAHSYSYHGYSLLPKFGVFSRVLRGGWILPGNEIHIIDSPDSG